MITSPAATFTVTEAARRLGISRMTLYRDMQRGRINVHHFVIGNKKMATITADDLADYALQYRRGVGVGGA